MDEQVLKVYAEVEEIKQKAEKLGYSIGEVKITQDIPYIKISIDLMKRLENGNEPEFKPADRSAEGFAEQ